MLSCIRVTLFSCLKKKDQYANLWLTPTFRGHKDPQIKKDMSLQIVLISGCSSGIGLATAVLLAKDAEKRFKVYATMRNLAKKGQLEEEGIKRNNLETLWLSNRWTCAVMNQSRRLLKRCSTLKGKLMCCVSGSRHHDSYVLLTI